MSVLIDAYLKVNDALETSEKLLTQWKANPSPENAKALKEADVILRKRTEEAHTILRTHKPGIN